MKKRIISVLLAAVFALSVIGCGTKDTKEQDAYRQYGITCMESGKYEDAIKASQLLEYAQQVRDAYKAQVDDQQNNNMQFLTVISTIFFPLT